MFNNHWLNHHNRQILLGHDCIEWQKESRVKRPFQQLLPIPWACRAWGELEKASLQAGQHMPCRSMGVKMNSRTWSYIEMRVDDDDLLTSKFPGILWDTRWPKARPAQIRLLQEFGQRTDQVADKAGKEAPSEESSVTHLSFQFCSL